MGPTYNCSLYPIYTTLGFSPHVFPNASPRPEGPVGFVDYIVQLFLPCQCKVLDFAGSLDRFVEEGWFLKSL
jgi:hypothetical protein